MTTSAYTRIGDYRIRRKVVSSLYEITTLDGKFAAEFTTRGEAERWIASQEDK